MKLSELAERFPPTVLFVASLPVCEESASVFQTPASMVGLPLSAFQGAAGGEGGVGGCRARLQGPLLS